MVTPITSKGDLIWKNNLCTCDCGFWDEITLDWGWALACAQSCLTLWDSMDCSPPGSSVHRIFQARILEWVAISHSRGLLNFTLRATFKNVTQYYYYSHHAVCHGPMLYLFYNWGFVPSGPLLAFRSLPPTSTSGNRWSGLYVHALFVVFQDFTCEGTQLLCFSIWLLWLPRWW